MRFENYILNEEMEISAGILRSLVPSRLNRVNNRPLVFNKSHTSLR